MFAKLVQVAEQSIEHAACAHSAQRCQGFVQQVVLALQQYMSISTCSVCLREICTCTPKIAELDYGIDHSQIRVVRQSRAYMPHCVKQCTVILIVCETVSNSRHHLTEPLA